MKNLLLIGLFFLITHTCYSFEVDKIDIENHPQSSFPKIAVTINNKTLDYYGSDARQGKAIVFMKEETQKLEGEIPLSGYIFAKEFVESFKFPKTLANKKTETEFVKIFTEKNPGKLIDFIISVNDRKRNAENEAELAIITKMIEKEKTGDEPGGTPHFSTGYIELKSPKDNNERYYIKLSDVNKNTMSLNANKTKISLLKAITIYSFQNALSSLNFGDIEKGSSEDLLYSRLEQTNLSLCSMNCPLDFAKDLSSMALNIGKIVTFEVVGSSKIENMNDFNKYVLAQQWCLLNEFTKSCHSPDLIEEVVDLEKNEIISKLIKEHKSKEDLCKFLQK